MNMDIIEYLEGTAKAGNQSRLKSKMIIIDMERESIIQRYDVETIDADGDVLRTDSSEQVLLSGESFGQWITEDMKTATLETIKADYELKMNPPEEA
jgi:hypothetical protein